MDKLEREKAVEKIKKCLALGKSANEHEAATALRQAQALMKKYGFNAEHFTFESMANLTTSEKVSKTPPQYILSLVNVIASAFGVHPILDSFEVRGARPTFFGVKECVEVAIYCFDICARQLKIQRREYLKTIHKNCKPRTRVRRADLYCAGWVSSVSKNLPDFELDNEAATAIKRYVSYCVGDSLSTVSSRGVGEAKLKDYDSYLKGKLEGKDFKVNPGIAGTSQQMLLRGG